MSLNAFALGLAAPWRPNPTNPTMSNVPNPQPIEAGQLEDHPLAQLFPLMTAAELDELTQAIQRSGLRDTIVLHEGKILDGRNRYRACIAANVKPRFRQWGQYEGDGDSPTRFVLDLNLERRHLTVGQKAAIAVDSMPFFEAEAKARQEAAGRGEAGPGKPGESAEHAAATVGVSAVSVRRAKAVKKKSPKAFDALKSGQASVNAAEEQARKEAVEGEMDDATKKLIADHLDTVTKTLGEEFAKALENGIILKDPTDLKDFLTLDSKDWKPIQPLISKGWTVKKALKFKQKSVARGDKLADLFLRVLCDGGRTQKMNFEVDGHLITVKLNHKGAAAAASGDDAGGE
jgi:hypothetical protein